jgi:hypothetical protein
MPQLAPASHPEHSGASGGCGGDGAGGGGPPGGGGDGDGGKTDGVVVLAQMVKPVREIELSVYHVMV